MGSSVGVSKVRDAGQLAGALDFAARFDRKLLVEDAVPNPREIEVSVLGNHAPVASVPGEIVPGNEFYDYNAKYIDDNSQLLIPARLDAASMRAGARLAVGRSRCWSVKGWRGRFSAGRRQRRIF
jgi:D-alanine-D-alanine ligase